MLLGRNTGQSETTAWVCPSVFPALMLRVTAAFTTGALAVAHGVSEGRVVPSALRPSAKDRGKLHKSSGGKGLTGKAIKGFPCNYPRHRVLTSYSKGYVRESAPCCTRAQAP